MLSVVPRTDWMEALVSVADAAVSFTEFARPAMFADTSSIEPDSSLTEETISSVDAATDSACDAVSLSEEAIWVTPPTASSSARTWTSAPSDTASAMRAIPLAESVTRRTRSRTSPTSTPFV